MRAVVEVGRPLIDSPGRFEDVRGLGVDEHAWQRADAHRHTQYATGVVGLTAGRSARLLDVTKGRSGGVYVAGWPPDPSGGAMRSRWPRSTRSAAV